MESLEQRLAHYQEVHSNESNKLMHYIGIPAVFIGIMMFLNWFSIGIFGRWHIEFAWFGVIGLLVYYYFLNVRLAVIATVILFIVTALATWIARPMPTTFSFILFLILFVGGGVLLYMGHTFEKKKPSFTRNITQLAIAPLFLIVELLEKFGLQSYAGLGKKPTKGSKS